MSGEDRQITRRRRPRSLTKQCKKVFSGLLGYGVFAFRYGVIPGAIFFSIKFTEPNPSLFELLVPGFAYLSF